MNSLLRFNKNGLFIYQFSIFNSAPDIIHGIFTRHGGFSQGNYKSLNLSFSVGDDPQRVVKNREQVLKVLNLEHLLSLKQVHGKNSVIIDRISNETGAMEPECGVGDILMTRIPNQGLMIKQADCQSVLLYDPQNRSIANIHCGWRGNVENVLGEAVIKMKTHFGSNPQDLLAGIGPSLGPCCAQFLNYRREFPREHWTYQGRPYYFDLWRLSRDQLIAAGLAENRIEIAGLCTSCLTKDFFSYRKKRETGRFATVIALK